MQSLCPICDSKNVVSFLYRNQVPVHQNLPLHEQEIAVKTTQGDLNLLVCSSCGFIFNDTFEPKKIAYNESYDNTQTYSQAFESHVDALIDDLVYNKQVQNCCVVEVGCGKGQFLRKLVEQEQWGNIGYGFDPSYVGNLETCNGRLKFKQCYYDEQCSGIQADVVICRHVIEHVPDPVKLLRTIRRALQRSPQARVFFETPCVEWILANQVIWDFFYEHCSYFTRDSLTTAFEISGFQVLDVRHIFGGQYLWLEAIPGNRPESIHLNPGKIPDLSQQFARAEYDLTAYWQEKINRLAEQGKVALWGAGAKGVTFANLIDPARRLIDCIIDLNPNKQSKYIPGTGHPIVSYLDIGKRGLTDIVLMNPNYYQENLALLNAHQLKANLITE
jgi:SAM-dependent methyltransferase